MSRDEWAIFKAHADVCGWPESNARNLFENLVRVSPPENLTRILQNTAKQMLSGYLLPRLVPFTREELKARGLRATTGETHVHG